MNDGHTIGTRTAQIGGPGQPHQGRHETRPAGGQETQARAYTQGGRAEGSAEDIIRLTANGVERAMPTKKRAIAAVAVNVGSSGWLATVHALGPR